jgi:hypothetical protein
MDQRRPSQIIMGAVMSIMSALRDFADGLRCGVSMCFTQRNDDIVLVACIGAPRGASASERDSGPRGEQRGWPRNS